MTKDELISRQQLEIEELKEKVEIAYACRERLHYVLYEIGGPLNDNKKRFDAVQLQTFARIASIYGF